MLLGKKEFIACGKSSWVNDVVIRCVFKKSRRCEERLHDVVWGE